MEGIVDGYHKTAHSAEHCRANRVVRAKQVVCGARRLCCRFH